MSEEKWYSQGLNFECTGCGKCCTGAPGYVWVNEEELLSMAAFLNISVEEFSKKYIRKSRGRLALLEKENYDCIFLNEKKCRVYGARPTQCRTYPFWPGALESEESWQTFKAECEGINTSARVVQLEEIEKNKLIQIKRNNNH